MSVTSSSIIRNYLFGDLSNAEYKSYIKYINGKYNETYWVEKALIKREPLLNAELKCMECYSYIDVKITGVCKCFNGHKCYKEVISFIRELN
jgi:hypothetical protein